MSKKVPKRKPVKRPGAKRAGPAGAKKSAGRWPRTSDLVPWMNAMLAEAPVVDLSDTGAVSKLSCAIGMLCKRGEHGRAIKHVESLVARARAFDLRLQASWLFRGAEVAVDRDDRPLAEAYLSRASRLVAGAPDKRRANLILGDIAYVRDHLALDRDPSKGELSPVQAIEAAEHGLGPALARGDRTGAQTLLDRAEAGALAGGGGALRSRVLKLFSMAGDSGGVARVLEADARSPSGDRILGHILLAAGLTELAIERLTAQAKTALLELARERLNAHFPASAFERAVLGLVRAGATALARELVEQALRDGGRWKLSAMGAFSSAVLRSMARAVAATFGAESALELVRLATQHADTDKPSGWRTQAVMDNAELMIELSPPAEAVEIAKSVRSPGTRRALLAEVYARRGDFDALGLVLDTCKDAEERVELIWKLRFVFEPI